MDVEKIQKVNNLALDLVRQGLAPDREEAIAQAEKIYEGDTEDYDAIREATIPVEPQQDLSPEEHTQELSHNQIKDILEQNTKFLVKKITQFQEKINFMEKEMQSLKSQLDYNKIPSAGQILTKEAVKTDEPQVQEESTEPKKEPHPSVGNYSEKDVSVEKFFYMGNG